MQTEAINKEFLSTFKQKRQLAHQHNASLLEEQFNTRASFEILRSFPKMKVFLFRESADQLSEIIYVILNRRRRKRQIFKIELVKDFIPILRNN